MSALVKSGFSCKVAIAMARSSGRMRPVYHYGWARASSEHSANGVGPRILVRAAEESAGAGGGALHPLVRPSVPFATAGMGEMGGLRARDGGECRPKSSCKLERRPARRGMAREGIHDSFDRLNVWSRNGQRAPHKPLLVLYALGRWSRGDAGPIPFRDVDRDLTPMLKEFGPHRQ